MSALILAATAERAAPPDSIRLLIVSLAGLSIGFVVLVAATYFVVWWKTHPRRGLLPVQVFLISVAHSVLLAYIARDIAERYRDALSWREPLLLFALVVNVIGLVTATTFQRIRLRHIRQDHPRRRVDDL